MPQLNYWLKCRLRDQSQREAEKKNRGDDSHRRRRRRRRRRGGINHSRRVSNSWLQDWFSVWRRRRHKHSLNVQTNLFDSTHVTKLHFLATTKKKIDNNQKNKRLIFSCIIKFDLSLFKTCWWNVPALLEDHFASKVTFSSVYFFDCLQGDFLFWWFFFLNQLNQEKDDVEKVFSLIFQKKNNASE